jgi:hypothetical protein
VQIALLTGKNTLKHMGYCIATDVDFPQIAQMRWDFRTEPVSVVYDFER